MIYQYDCIRRIVYQKHLHQPVPKSAFSHFEPVDQVNKAFPDTSTFMVPVISP